jgi:biotin synthase
VGTAEVLGLLKLRQEVTPTTAHLLEPGKCVYNCGFCTQAKDASSDSEKLARIAWPLFPELDVINSLRENRNKFERVCLQTVNVKGEEQETIRRVSSLVNNIQLPISVDTRPHDISVVDSLFNVGVEVVGIPIDAVNQDLFRRVRGGSLKNLLEIIKMAAEKYPGRISQKLHSWNVTVGLFALTPMRGTFLAHTTPPSISSYRRIQAAKALIESGHNSFIYNDGLITGFDLSFNDMKKKVPPESFKTSGCSSCNRPYYNESPSDIPYNYPRSLIKEEYNQALSQMNVEYEDG